MASTRSKVLPVVAAKARPTPASADRVAKATVNGGDYHPAGQHLVGAHQLVLAEHVKSGKGCAHRQGRLDRVAGERYGCQPASAGLSPPGPSTGAVGPRPEPRTSPARPGRRGRPIYQRSWVRKAEAPDSSLDLPAMTQALPTRAKPATDAERPPPPAQRSLTRPSHSRHLRAKPAYWPGRPDPARAKADHCPGEARSQPGRTRSQPG